MSYTWGRWFESIRGHMHTDTRNPSAAALRAKYSGVFLVDVEATSRTPMTGVMTELAVVHMVTGSSFYGHLYRNRPHTDTPALPVVDLDDAGRPLTEPFWTIETSAENRTSASTGLVDLARALAGWLDAFHLERRTLVSDNNGFDAMWLNCFTDDQLGAVLFGHSSRRIGDFYAGQRGKWNDQSSWKSLRRTRHTHNPLDDARGNAEALRALLALD